MESLRSVWESLWTPELTMFQSYRWNSTAAQIFAGREEPYVVVAENDHGAAIIPATIDPRQRQIRLLGETLFDYRDYLSNGDPDPLHAAWEKLAELKLPLSVTSVRRPEAAFWEALPMIPYGGAPYILCQSGTSFTFDGAHTRLASRLRKLFGMGVVVNVHDGRDERLVRHIYESKNKQGAAENLFRDKLRIEFMVEIAKRAAADCEIFTFERDSQLIAALVTFRDEKWRRCYTVYYNHLWARYSPGMKLLFEVACRSIAEGMSVDLMTGEQPYKMRIANAVQPLFRIEAAAAQLREALTERSPLWMRAA
jgi:CelD/BcsL family acetyltransferase involved in cellulose biosynthesis